MQDEQVKACNLVMDEKTGLRPDGQTCRECWEAVYHRASHFIGPDENPCRMCKRVISGSPYSVAVTRANQKLKYLEKSRAAGNR